MTKNDIVVEITRKSGLTYKQVRRVVQMTLDQICNTIVREGRIELRNFGVLDVRVRRARRARNPRTGETVSVGERRTVFFKPGLHLLNKLKKQGHSAK
jgi:nucleoid DNA-binding protein